MSHAENTSKWYGPSKILPWSALSNEHVKVGDESGGSCGFIPFYRTPEEVARLFGNINIVEFDCVKEITSKETISQKSCCKREGSEETRKDSCGGKSCKANRPTTKGDGECH